MQDVVESWLMVSLTKSLILVALEPAGSLPVVLLALPAGAFADLIDRRKLLLATQIWMFGCRCGDGSLTFTGVMTLPLLLVLPFTLGRGPDNIEYVVAGLWQEQIENRCNSMSLDVK